jgi:hypothetical protein
MGMHSLSCSVVCQDELAVVVGTLSVTPADHFAYTRWGTLHFALPVHAHD